MSERKVTDQEWADARKRYETEPGLGLGKIAQALDCSKSLVARKAREERWQKDFGVPSQVHPTAREREANFTESSVHPAKQAVHVHTDEPPVSRARVVADTFIAPAASSAYSDEMQVPGALDEIDREEFIKAAVVARQKAINGRHLKELNAARAKLYESLKASGSKDGPAVALASQRNIAALIALQGAEMESELQRVRLEVAEFVGRPMKPTACRIFVHVREGQQLLGTAIYGSNATEVIDSQGVINVRN